jgi:hypothetical protein
MTKQNYPNLPIPYDKLWKSIVTEHFEDFLEMFLPDLYKEADYNTPMIWKYSLMNIFLNHKILPI